MPNNNYARVAQCCMCECARVYVYTRFDVDRSSF